MFQGFLVNVECCLASCFCVQHPWKPSSFGFHTCDKLLYVAFFPTGQVRVSRFYQSYFLLPPPLSSELQISVGCRTLTASSKSQWALPDLNCERQISVGTARYQLRVQDVTYNVKRDVR